MRRSMIPLAAALAALTGCPADTCSGGDTLANARLDAAKPPLATASSFDVLFDKVSSGPAAALSDSYFGQGTPHNAGGVDGGVSVRTVQLVDRNRLRFDLSGPLGAGSSAFVDFPDRKGFMQCTHPGMADVYTVKFSVTQAGDAGYALGVAQTYQPGAI